VSRRELLLACFGRDDFLPADLVLETVRGDAVLAHAEIYQRKVGVGGRDVWVAGIAQVGVDPAYRRIGLATALVRAAHIEARSAGIDFAALFSEYLWLYEPIGYEQVDEARPNFLVRELRGDWPDGEIDTHGEW
jgi:predicted acetyltransferase